MKEYIILYLDTNDHQWKVGGSYDDPAKVIKRLEELNREFECFLVKTAMNDFFCNETCKKLSLTEKKQDELKREGIRQGHVCLKFDEKVHHGNCHPHILKHKKCDL